MKKSTITNYATYGGVIIAFVVLYILNNFGMLGPVLSGQLVPICAYVVMALSLNLTVGVLGELSLGHAGFMSVGAFAGATANIALAASIPNTGVRLAVVLVIATICAAIAGVLIGIPVLRLRGDYLAIVTLAFGEIIKSIVNNLYIGMDAKGLHFAFLNAENLKMDGGKMILKGSQGITIMPTSTFVAGFVLVMITLVIIFNLVGSRSGRAIMALRDNRIAAESVGINVTKYKMMAFVTSAALAGAAGALYAQGMFVLDPKKFNYDTSILILVFVVLGGLGRMWGSIIAAAALTVLPELLREVRDYRMLAYAIVLILVMLVTNNPTIKNFVQAIAEKFKGKKVETKGAGQQ